MKATLLPHLLKLFALHIVLGMSLVVGLLQLWCEIEVVLAGADVATADSLHYIYRPLPAGALHVEFVPPPMRTLL